MGIYHFAPIGKSPGAVTSGLSYLKYNRDVLSEKGSIIENIILGYAINPGESDEAMIQFGHDKGFEKCGLPPGTGVRIAAEFMIDSMEE